MGIGIPEQAVAVSVVVLVYSWICFTSSTLLALLLWTYGEKFTYVMIFSTFTSIATLASFIQQIHYAVAWSIIKQSQFDLAVMSISHPGLAFGGAAEQTDVILFYIQFFCYNTMALNILFWAVTLVIGAWNIRFNNFRLYNSHIYTISKIFTVLFPGVIIGLMHVEPILDSAGAFFIVSNITLLFCMLAGTICLILTLYKYMKTRRLVAGPRERGGWWASGSSKGQRSGNISTQGSTAHTSSTDESRRSIYDRALITRFTIGFCILLIFEIAIIVFNLVQRSNNMALAAAGQPNMDPAGAIADVVFFIPGVTASLVAFLVFGTTKSWRQYWGLFTGVCGIRSKIVQKRAARRVASPEQSLEFQRLPSLTRNLAEEERARTAEAEDRVRIYSQLPESTGVGELVRSTTLKGLKKSVVHVKEQEVSSGGPAGTRNFHRPFPSTSSNTYGSPGSAEIDIHISSNDLVVQRGNERFDEELGNEMQQGIMVERQYYVESSYEVPPSMLPKRIDFREDASV